jgi:hypothetical protein
MIFKNKIPTTSIRQKPFSKFSQVAQMAILNKFYKTLTSHKSLLTVKIRQPSHEFTFGVGISFISYPLVLTPVV